MADIQIDHSITDTADTLSDIKIPEVVPYPIDESLIPIEGISFYVMRLSKAIVVHSQRDFFIGRDVDEDIWRPLVDLGELDGYAMGVSRRHAMIRPVERGYEVIDLFSTNGTWLDDQRLIPNKPYPLAPGAQLRLGQERLLVVYRSARVSQQEK
jgi:pSer/pThr/pTyr-binding forkhead associated (FHA) protein